MAISNLTHGICTLADMTPYITDFVRPAICHLLAMQTCHHLEVKNIVLYINTQQQSQVALMKRLKVSFQEVYTVLRWDWNMYVSIAHWLNSLNNQLNEQIPYLIDESMNNRSLTFQWFRDVTRHIIAMECYANDLELYKVGQELLVADMVQCLVILEESFNARGSKQGSL